MKLFIILGNQLFPETYIKDYKDQYTFFMAEDLGLCTHQKPNKKKILLFLSAMRSYADGMRRNNFKIIYHDLDSHEFKSSYIWKLNRVLELNNVKSVSFFEIEDKFLENEIVNYLKDNEIDFNILNSPMFLTSRTEFSDFLLSNKPFMATFYKYIRKKHNIMMDSNMKPVGGKWSFDSDNRKRIPDSIPIPAFPKIEKTEHTKKLIPIIEKQFLSHYGNLENFDFVTEYEKVDDLFNFFLEKKLDLFGDYEDALSKRDNILFHSKLSPYINMGLITPEYIIEKTLDYHQKNNIRLNSIEGFIRQIIGWREFIRGIYQNYSEEMEQKNFFNHTRSMRDTWYTGKTGIPPLDHCINNAFENGWSHHIERLMVLANIMNLCEIHPSFVYRWFMEAFVDSSDWVMIPNVYGMGLFSDGGIFSTKPYICGSNYILKMMDFQKGEWCETLDGLYWRFIDKNRQYFKSNPRLSIMVGSLDRMNADRKSLIFSKAEAFIKENSYEYK
ncbi:MAG: cryptochrome/photolyase family protein [Hyphomicrobiales bacterium]|nr:cryptochrome/photolyase family protein [Hyphomicrobiales bacterium]